MFFVPGTSLVVSSCACCVFSFVCFVFSYQCQHRQSLPCQLTCFQNDQRHETCYVKLRYRGTGVLSWAGHKTVWQNSVAADCKTLKFNDLQCIRFHNSALSIRLFLCKIAAGLPCCRRLSLCYRVYRVGQILPPNFMIFGTYKLHKATNGTIPILC